MDQLSTLITQLNDPTLDEEGRLMLRCRLSKELVFAGDFQGAREALGEYWPDEGAGPTVAGLGARAEGELLLRVGSPAVSRWSASSRLKSMAKRWAR